MARIFIPTKVSKGNKAEEETIFMKVDTAADRTIIDENICKELKLEKVGESYGRGFEGVKKKYNEYRAVLKIKGCKPPVSFHIIGGPKEKNLLGHDILQALDAKIDEKESKLICPTQL